MFIYSQLIKGSFLEKSTISSNLRSIDLYFIPRMASLKNILPSGQFGVKAYAHFRQASAVPFDPLGLEVNVLECPDAVADAVRQVFLTDTQVGVRLFAQLCPPAVEVFSQCAAAYGTKPVRFR